MAMTTKSMPSNNSTALNVRRSSPELASMPTIPKWKYSPAELAGCKVARVYHFSATAPAAKKTP